MITQFNFCTAHEPHLNTSTKICKVVGLGVFILAWFFLRSYKIFEKDTWFNVQTNGIEGCNSSLYIIYRHTKTLIYFTVFTISSPF